MIYPAGCKGQKYKTYNMKKIFTLAIASLFTVALFAADKRPSVMVQSARNYEIVIDGRSYTGNRSSIMDLKNLQQGRHTISVYKIGQGFRKTRQLVSTSSFRLRNKDVRILVDQFGSIRIAEAKNGKIKNNRDDNRDWDDDFDRGFDNDPRDRNDNRRF